MRLILNQMKIRNFKGIKKLDIDFDEKLTAICGDNGCGKTSIVDAYLWTLFDKDSHGNASGTDAFRSKPLDESGNETHNVAVSVNLRFALDDNVLELSRVQTESWVSRRGSTIKDFKGNVSTYKINGVEAKLTEFKAKIAEMGDEKLFRLVGTLGAVNNLTYQDRRSVLIDMAGQDVDSALLSDSEWKSIADECTSRNLSPDSLNKLCKERLKTARQAQMAYPIRIDECEKTMPQLTEREITDAKSFAADCKATVESIDNQIAAANAECGETANQVELRSLESELLSVRRAIQTDYETRKSELYSQKRSICAENARIRDFLANTYNDKERVETRLREAENAIEELRNQYRGIAKETFDANGISTVCPTCGQPLPTDDVDYAVQSAKAKFEQAKQDKKVRISLEGLELGKEIEAFKKQLLDIDASIESQQSEFDKTQMELTFLERAIVQYPDRPDYEGSKEFAEIQSRIVNLRGHTPSGTAKERIDALKARKAEVEVQLEDVNAVLANVKLMESCKERIDALQKEQSDVCQEVAELEQTLDDLTRYVQKRCTLLEERINDCFPNVRWKLFNVQINGGVQDCCVCLIPCDGALVTYESANTAARINADVEIIGAMAKRYDMYLPLFVDNKERVNHLQEIDTQVVTLAVTTDKKLTVRKGALQ